MYSLLESVSLLHRSVIRVSKILEIIYSKISETMLIYLIILFAHLMAAVVTVLIIVVENMSISLVVIDVLTQSYRQSTYDLPR